MKKNTILALLAITLFVGVNTKGISLGKASSSNRNRTTAPNRTSTRASSAVNRSAVNPSAVSRSAVSRSASVRASSTATRASNRYKTPTLRSMSAQLRVLLAYLKGDIRTAISGASNFAATAATNSTLAANNTSTILTNQDTAATQAANDVTAIKGDIAGVNTAVTGASNFASTAATNAATAATNSTLAANNTSTILTNQDTAATQAAADLAAVKGDIAGISSSGGASTGTINQILTNTNTILGKQDTAANSIGKLPQASHLKDQSTAVKTFVLGGQFPNPNNDPKIADYNTLVKAGVVSLTNNSIADIKNADINSYMADKSNKLERGDVKQAVINGAYSGGVTGEEVLAILDRLYTAGGWSNAVVDTTT